LASGAPCRAEVLPSGCTPPDVCRPTTTDAPLSSAICQPALELGGLCAGFGAQPCGANLRCSSPSSGEAPRCHTGRARGSSCEELSAVCHEGAVCSNVPDELGIRRCTPLRGLGEPCLDAPCQLDMVCGSAGRCEYGCRN
jgi:hypothetical protein